MSDARAQAVFDELAAEQLRQPGTGRRRMFGRDGLSADGKFFAFLDHVRTRSSPRKNTKPHNDSESRSRQHR